jgi:hypothetical protein
MLISLEIIANNYYMLQGHALTPFPTNSMMTSVFIHARIIVASLNQVLFASQLAFQRDPSVYKCPGL